MDSGMWPRQSCKSSWRRWTIIMHGGSDWACLAKRKTKMDLLVTNLWNHDYSCFLAMLLAQWYNCTHLSTALAFTRAAAGAAELLISVFQCGRSYNRSCHNYPSGSFPRPFFFFPRIKNSLDERNRNCQERICLSFPTFPKVKEFDGKNSHSITILGAFIPKWWGSSLLQHATYLGVPYIKLYFDLKPFSLYT